MDLDKWLAPLGLDRYVIAARLQPALFAAAPALVLAWLVWGAIPVIGIALAAWCFSRPIEELVREGGLRVEERAGSRIGNALTARLLGHEDDRISDTVKAAVRAHVQRHYPIELPDREAARRYPDRARQAFIEAARVLAAERRDEAVANQLFAANTSYGFWRNLLGLRPWGLALACATSGLAMLLTARGVPALQEGRGLLLVLATIALAALWWRLDLGRVERASVRYARRLFDILAARIGGTDIKQGTTPTG